MSNDILSRESQKSKRVQEHQEEFSISQLVRAGMKDYTKQLQEFINGDSRLIPKKAIEGMFQGDEATLALIVLRTTITVLIREKTGKVLLSSMSKILGKSMLTAKTLAQLDSEHQALSNYIDRAYKRSKDSKRLKAKMRSALNIVGQIKEEELLDKGDRVIGIGSLLLTILCETIDIIEIIKLDSKSRHQGVHYPEYKPYSYLVHFTEETKYALLDLEAVAEELMKPTVLPQLEKPQAVNEWDLKDSDLIRTGRPRNVIKMPKKKQNLRDYRFAMDNSNMGDFLKIHHMIESTEWTINSDIKNVISEVFENNILNRDLSIHKGEHYEFNPECLGGLPRRYSLEVSNLIDKSKLGRTKFTENGRELFDDDKEGLNRYNRISNDLLAFNEANLNKALSLKSMLNVAEQFEGKKFWYTYQLDTRSRFYPVQGTLNPQSDKKGKALLKFSGKHGARPLTEEGHYWAKVHGANSWGLDKADIPDRVAFIDTLIEKGDIQKIAEMSLAFTDLWSQTDDPFGFLAFCVEYNKCLKDPEYPYAIACALDATCSGLQIYAGLLLDREGAKTVNVIGQKRNDIYGIVADRANEKLLRGDYERFVTFTNANDEEDTVDYKPVGDSLAGKIHRGISKRNTMTQPYSVTMKGMQDQLKETFTELEQQGKRFWRGEIWQCSRLLADVHQRSIDEVVEGAKRGKEFIKAITAECAKRNKGLLWTTHTGFPVYQKNVKSKECRIESHIWTPDSGAQRVQFRVTKRVGRVNTHSQKNSSAPNLIHSLDSSLLQVTVRRCWERGVRSFALIHDSYGVHPNDVPILNEEVREAFIEIFSEDVLYDWAIEVLTNAGFTFDEMAKILGELPDPMLNTLDLNEVRDATFMFS